MAEQIKDCWYIEGRAYNLAPFLDAHPGGRRVLEQSIGVDATHLFRTYHALSNIEAIRKAMRRYEIRSFDAEGDMRILQYLRGSGDRHDPLYPKLCAHVKEHFERRKLSHKCPVWLYPWYALWAAVLALGLKAWVGQGSPSAIPAISLGMWFFSGDLLHTGTHFAMFQSRFMNSLVAYGFGFLFCNPVVWIRQHVVGHHSDTNLQTDPDLHHFKPSSYWEPLRRLVGDADVPFFLSVALSHTPGVFYHPLRMLILKDVYFHLPTVSVNKPREWISMFAFWAVSTILYATVVFRHGWMIASAPMLLFGVMFYTFSQVSHMNVASSPGVHDPDTPWSVRQIASSRGDYSTRSRFLWPMLSVGLNLQTVHHLFPTVHWIWYPNLIEGILGIAGESPVFREKTLLKSILEHISYVIFA